MPQADRFHHPFLSVCQDYKTGLGGLNLARGDCSATGVWHPSVQQTAHAQPANTSQESHITSLAPLSVPGTTRDTLRKTPQGMSEQNLLEQNKVEGGGQMNLHSTSSE